MPRKIEFHETDGRREVRTDQQRREDDPQTYHAPARWWRGAHDEKCPKRHGDPGACNCDIGYERRHRREFL